MPDLVSPSLIDQIWAASEHCLELVGTSSGTGTESRVFPGSFRRRRNRVRGSVPRAPISLARDQLISFVHKHMHCQLGPVFRRLALDIRRICREALETIDTLAKRVRLIGLDVQGVQLRQCTRHDDGHSAAARPARDRRGRRELAIVNQRHAGRGEGGRTEQRSGTADLSRRSSTHTRAQVVSTSPSQGQSG